MNKDTITIALPTGRLGKTMISMLGKANILNTDLITSRLLDVYDKENNIRYLLVKPSDVITYVNEGVCDLGIVGKDTLLEEEKDVYELYDLKIGKCNMSIAGFNEAQLTQNDKVLVVATKYPKITRNYFKSINKTVEIVKLNGSVELAPLVGLSDVIVDIVETGETLRANGLEVLRELIYVSARIISNQVSYRFKKDKIDLLIKRMEESSWEYIKAQK